jgi:hypothetical protein
VVEIIMDRMPPDQKVREMMELQRQVDEEENLVPTRLTCKSTERFTPRYIIRAIKDLFGGYIELDPATTVENPVGARRFFTKETNGLVHPWEHKTMVNPPYGEDISDWTAKIRVEAGLGFSIAAILPCGARFSTKYWQNDVLIKDLTAMCVVNHRVHFEPRCVKCMDSRIPCCSEEPGNIYDTIIYCYNIPPRRVKLALGCLGRIIGTEVM